jgi:MFS family permease
MGARDRRPVDGVTRSPRDLGWIYAVALCMFFAYSVAGFTLPLRVRELGASPLWIGAVSGVRLAVAAVLAMPAGRASDRFGRRRILLASGGLLTASTAMMSVADSVFTLLVASVVGGLGSAAVLPTLNATVASTVRQEGHATGFAYLTLCMQGGMSIGPAVAGYVIDHVGYAAAFAVSAALNALALAPIRVGVPADDTAAGGPAEAADPGHRAANAMLRSPAIWTAWLCAFAAAMIWGTNSTLVPAYFRARGWAPSVIGLLMAAQTAANAGSRIPLAWAFRRIAPRPAVAAAAIGAYALYFWTLPLLVGVAAVGAAMTVSSLFVALVYMIVQVHLAQSSPPGMHGLVMGGYATAIYLGLSLGPMLCGAAAAALGYPAGFRVVASIAIVPAAYAAWRARAAPPRPSAAPSV